MSIVCHQKGSLNLLTEGSLLTLFRLIKLDTVASMSEPDFYVEANYNPSFPHFAFSIGALDTAGFTIEYGMA